MHQLTLPLLLLSMFLVSHSHTQTDTLVSVFHHNYLVEKHAELAVFAEELVAYAQSNNCSDEVRNRALRYQENVVDINVWESEDVVATMNRLDALLNRGVSLHRDVVIEANRMQLKNDTLKFFKSVLPYGIAILLFPALYYVLFWRK